MSTLFENISQNSEKYTESEVNCGMNDPKITNIVTNIHKDDSKIVEL